MHLAVHLGFHLGQAGYLRRVVTGDGRSSGALPLAALADRRRSLLECDPHAGPADRDAAAKPAGSDAGRVIGSPSESGRVASMRSDRGAAGPSSSRRR